MKHFGFFSALLLLSLGLTGCMTDSSLANYKQERTDSLYTFKSLWANFEVPLTNGLDVIELGNLANKEESKKQYYLGWLIPYDEKDCLSIRVRSSLSVDEYYETNVLFNKYKKDPYWNFLPPKIPHWYQIYDNRWVFYGGETGADSIVVLTFLYYHNQVISISYYADSSGNNSRAEEALATIKFPSQSILGLYNTLSEEAVSIFLGALIFLYVVILSINSKKNRIIWCGIFMIFAFVWVYFHCNIWHPVIPRLLLSIGVALTFPLSLLIQDIYYLITKKKA